MADNHPDLARIEKDVRNWWTNSYDGENVTGVKEYKPKELGSEKVDGFLTPMPHVYFYALVSVKYASDGHTKDWHMRVAYYENGGKWILNYASPME